MKQISVRFGKKSDLDRISEIERNSFPDPWDGNYIQEILERTEQNTGAVRVIVAEGDGLLEGFVIFSLIDGEAEIYDIAAAPESRGKGVGTALASAVRELADKVFLEVHQANVPARALYEKLGFKPVSVRKAYYGDGGDAMIMQWKDE